MLLGVRTPFPRPMPLATCTADQPDIAVLEGATHPIIFHAVLTPRWVLAAGRSLPHQWGDTFLVVGSTSAKDEKVIFSFFPMQLPLSCSCRSQRCPCGWHQRPRETAARRLHLRLCLDERWRLLPHGAAHWGRLGSGVVAGAPVVHGSGAQGHLRHEY